MSLYNEFYQLHYGASPLLIGNVWDAASAKIFQQAGFKAIATSSAAVANTYGFEDGGNLPFELLLQTVQHIQRLITIPLSVDMEGGYSNTIQGIITNIDKLLDAGVAGINIEDSVKGVSNQLQHAEDFVKTIEAIANHLEQKNAPLFINARIDTLVVKHPDAIAETIKRAGLYEQAGAKGVFVPFMYKPGDIVPVVQATKLPVNVFAMPQLPGFDELGNLGVKRISMGTSVYRKMMRDVAENLTTVQWDKSFKCLY